VTVKVVDLLELIEIDVNEREDAGTVARLVNSGFVALIDDRVG
jgi:hypothetical protein